MIYINPFDLLLSITSDNTSDGNDLAIKKAKRKLFAEIELSDSQTILYEEVELNKSNCIKILDELDDKNKFDFHLFIFYQKNLLSFLTRNDLIFFEKYQVESIYKSIDFINFISPYFSESYNSALLKNIRYNNYANVEKILSVPPIVNEQYLDKCYNGSYVFLKNVEAEINTIIRDIDAGRYPLLSKKCDGISNVVTEKVNISIVNKLPSYFQSIRNQLAEAINNLSTVVYNEPNSFIVPAFKLMEIAKAITTDGLTQQKITKDYFIVKKELDKEKHKLVLDKCNEIIADVISKLQAIDNKTISAAAVNDWANSTIEISFINALDMSFQGVKDDIALCLKALSVAVWNNFSYSEYAESILAKALNINTSEEVKAQLNEANNTLRGLKSKVLAQRLSNISAQTTSSITRQTPTPTPRRQTSTPTPTSSSSPTIARTAAKEDDDNSAIYILVSIAIAALIIYAAASHKSSDSNNYATPAQYEPAITPEPIGGNNYSSYNTAQEQVTPPTPVFRYVSMNNGNITDCPKIHPKYNYDINNKLIISVGSNANAAVKMVDIVTEKCIRYVYIERNSTYTIRNIPEGRYYLKIAYGDNWGHKEDEGSCSNRFTSSTLFKKSDNILDYNLIDEGDGRYQIPSYSLELNVVVTNNDGSGNSLSTNSISENSFYDE